MCGTLENFALTLENELTSLFLFLCVNTQEKGKREREMKNLQKLVLVYLSGKQQSANQGFWFRG